MLTAGGCTRKDLKVMLIIRPCIHACKKKCKLAIEVLLFFIMYR